MVTLQRTHLNVRSTGSTPSLFMRASTLTASSQLPILPYTSISVL